MYYKKSDSHSKRLAGDAVGQTLSGVRLGEQMDIVLHILGFLPDSHKAAVAKLICKATYRELKQYRIINADDCGGLPTACLVDFLQQYADFLPLQWQLMAALAKQADLPRLHFVRNHGCAWDEAVCVAAAKAGNLAVLQWLRAQTPPCPWDSEVCRAAAANGHLDVLQWLRAQNPPCEWFGDTMFYAAAADGNVAMLQWLRAQDPPRVWHGAACAAAAGHGHLATLQWLRSQDPPYNWDTQMCVLAADKGHLEILKWALAQDPPAPWDAPACILAAIKGHLHILQWVAAQQPPLDWNKDECLQMARSRSRACAKAAAVVTWLESLLDGAG